MDVLEFHDRRVRASGLRNMVVSTGMLVATVIIGVAVLTAPQPVKSATVDVRSVQKIDRLERQVDEQADELRNLRTILEACLKPAGMCSPTGEPLMDANIPTKRVQSDRERVVEHARTVNHTTVVEPPPAERETKPTSVPPDPVSDVTGVVSDTTRTITGLLDR